MRSGSIIGIDEVGRGALAGPVVVAAARVASGKWRGARGERGALRDSKKLSPMRRKAWFDYFKNHPKISYAVAFVYPRQIEKRNISRAANLAAWRAYQRLLSSPLRGGKAGVSSVFLDGGLFLGNRKKNPSTRFALSGRTTVMTVVRGDEKIPAVAVASIIAKVIRDRAMVRLAKYYPDYGFEIHKGYGTKRHLAAIKRHGPCASHRMTFLRSS